MIEGDAIDFTPEKYTNLVEMDENHLVWDSAINGWS